MAQNITLLGASYSDVPAVTLPKTGGGTAKFTDVTDSTLTQASDLMSGVTAYGNNGTLLTGTGSSGGVDGDNLGYGITDGTIARVGIAKVDSAVL